MNGFGKCPIPGCPNNRAKYHTTCLDHKSTPDARSVHVARTGRVPARWTRAWVWEHVRPFLVFLACLLVFSGVVFWTVKVIKFAGG